MPLDVESIVESIEMLDRELEEIKRQAKDGHLKPKSDETVILVFKFAKTKNELNSRNIQKEIFVFCTVHILVFVLKTRTF